MPKRGRSDGQKYQYTKNPAAITHFLKTMLYMFIAVSITPFVTNIIQLNLLSSVLVTEADVIANSARLQLVIIQSLIVFIVTGAVFLFWIYRANVNCHGFGAKNMRFSPRWSIGYFFIPILNLFEPYLAMKEIWRVSTDPAAWRQEKGSALVVWWWVFWLITLCTFVTSLIPMNVASKEAVQTLTVVALLTSVTDILHGIVALLLVTAIYKKQEELVRPDS